MDFDNLHNDQLQFFESILFKALGREVSVTEYQFLSGGCINNALRVDTPAGTFCIKYNEHSPEDMFACEARGLALLRSTNAIHIPEVIGYGRENQKAYLILEFVHSAPPGATYWTDFGLALARLHGETQAYFGLDHNNYVGSLRQSNEPADNWIDFFVEKRLQVQAGLALYNQALPRELFDKFTRLYAKLPDLLPAEKPALLHGDLWNGNVMTNRTGAACLIDPAVYYGSREAELAMTKLFGGFDPEFYQAYQQVSPLEPGYQERFDIYNLYPLLIHVNLFGSGYLPGVERVLKRYC